MPCHIGSGETMNPLDDATMGPFHAPVTHFTSAPPPRWRGIRIPHGTGPTCAIGRLRA
jgi:hypothetical protein